MKMKSFVAIQEEIKEWARVNFGVNQSKVDPDLMLGSLAPLMGMTEEVGEVTEAETQADLEDGLADVLIYACDYAAREGMDFRSFIPNGSVAGKLGTVHSLMGPLGRLHRATLKRHQGIRGHERWEVYEQHRDNAFKDFLDALFAFIIHSARDVPRGLSPRDMPLVLLNRTWSCIVSKRDWTKDADQGGGHSHEAPRTDPHGTDPNAFVDGPQ